MRVRKTAAVLVLLSVGVAACSSDDEAGSSTSSEAATNVSSGATGGPQEVINLHMLSTKYFGLEWIADHEGFFTDHGLNVDIEDANLFGVAGVTAVIQGEGFSMQTSPPLGYIQVASQGGSIKIIAAGAKNGGGYDILRAYVAADSGIDVASDLKGKRLAIAGPGSLGQYVWRGYLKQYGIPESDVTFVTVPTPEMGSALTSGQVDAIIMHDVFYSQFEQTTSQDQWKELFATTNDDTGLQTEQLGAAYIVSSSFLERNAEGARRFVAALQDAAQFTRQHPEESVSIISQVTGVESRFLSVPTFPDNLCLDLGALDSYISFMVDLGEIKEGAVSASELATNDANPSKCS